MTLTDYMYQEKWEEEDASIEDNVDDSKTTQENTKEDSLQP